MKKLIIIILISLFSLLVFNIEKVSAMPVGTLLYRTSSNGQLYGLNQKELISSKKGLISDIYSGHSAIYVGKIDGKDYIVEALAGGLQKTEAKYFIDESQGEKFLGARIPKEANDLQRQMAAEIALALSEYYFSYDFDFHKQKGPGDGEWTCVGLTEKVYESANINNPYDFSQLNYDSNYAVNITPDGYDDYSTYNSRGDVFSRSREFSMIKAYTSTIIPSPEILGFNMGRQYKGDRYFFFPYTQFLQDSLEEVDLDIDIGSNSTSGIRPNYKSLPHILKYTFINQPLSMIKKLGDYLKEEKAVAYSADNTNNYQIENTNSDINEKEGKEQRLSALTKEEISSNNNLDEKKVSDYSNLIENLNEIEGGADTKASNEKALKNKIEENVDYFVKEIISADTFLLENDLQITLASVSVPQLANKLWQADECQAREANDLVEKLLKNNKIRLRYGNKLNFDSSSRLVAYIYYRDNEKGEYKLLNNELLKHGLANLISCKQSLYCDSRIHQKLKSSYQQAKDNKLGIFSNICKKQNDNKKNKLSDLGKNLFKGINLKANQLINNLGQVINKPKKNAKSMDDSNDNLANDDYNDTKVNNDVFNDDSDSEDGLESNDDNNNISGDNNDNYNNCIDNLLISAIYTTKQDDWIELYNNCDEDIDLAKSNIRLEKAVSSDNPSIIIRFNQVDDFTSSNTIIKARDTYIISRAEANLNFNVDAISLRNNFSLGDSGYSVYLAKGPVSDIYDEDIIDLLGYGSSNYYRGTKAALAIDDYYVLRRKENINSNVFNLYPQHRYGLSGVYNSGHNYQDYILLDTGLNPEENNDNLDDDSSSDNLEDNNDDVDDDTSNNSDGDDTDNSEDDTENETEEDPQDSYNSCVDELLITAIYTTGQDDFIEIYNNCDQSIDLSEENIRLEKAISMDDPSIIIRFNELSDYLAASTIIEPYSTYLISREEASLDINFDAISTRADFSFTGSAYTVYLAKGPVSSHQDEDIIDILAYGSANYYLGSGPAPAIDDYYLLRRKAESNSSVSSLDIFHDYSLTGVYNSDNNFSDFISIYTDFYEDINNEDENDIDEPIDNQEEDDVNIISLWHLDSCFGDYVYDELSESGSYHNWQWSAKESGCVLKTNNREDILALPVSNDLDANNMTVVWDYQFEDEYSRMNLELVTREGDNLILTLSPYYIELTKSGHSKVRYNDYSLPLDNNWHRLALTTNILDSSLNIYLDNTILTTFTLGQRLYDLDDIKFMSDYNGSDLQIDEIALFDKPLDETSLNSLGTKINPYLSPSFVGTLDLKHSWNFIEGQGDIAHDTVNSYNLNINNSYWSTGVNDYGIELNQSRFEVSSDLLIDEQRKSFSLSFWYRNSAFPDEGRGRIMLKQGTDTKLGLKFTPYNSYLYYNHKEIPLSAHDTSIPHDPSWHHFVISYNASNYILKLYIDGIEVYSQYKPWLERAFDYMEIMYENWNFQLDEIKIYEGVLIP